MIALLATLAFAQVTRGDVPEGLDGQLFAPSIDARDTIWTDDSLAAPDGWWTVRSAFHYAWEPLAYEYGNGERVALMSDLMQLDLMGAYTKGPVRFGLYLPVVLFGHDAANGNQTGLGDLALDVRGTLVDRRAAPVGFALAGRLSLPTTTIEAPIGTGKVGFEAKAIADWKQGPVLLAANVGYQTAPPVELENMTWDDQLFARFGAGYAVTEDLGLSLDLGAQVNASDVGSTGYPVEALLGGWGRVGDEGLVLRAGAGTGLSAGVGAPRLRVIFSVAWEPPVVRDTDLDGLLDGDDVCPAQPEDLDGIDDTDGCPEGTRVVVEVRDVQDKPIEGAKWALSGGSDVAGVSGDKAELFGGTYTLKAWAAGYEAVEQVVEIPDAEAHEISLVLVADNPVGMLTVNISDVDGNPLPEARFVVINIEMDPLPGAEEVELPAGRYTIRAWFEGHQDVLRRVNVPEGGSAEVNVFLAPAKIEVSAEQIELRESVFFETDKAVIKPESYPLLDQVASTLIGHPALTRVRIEGHTDSRGSDAHNDDLSQRRADAVRLYLVGAGVEPERLEAVGFGEQRPLVQQETEEAWAQNRRVEIYILERGEE